MAGMQTFSQYLDQLLLTATKGRVIAEYAIHIDRVMLCCQECNVTLTINPPSSVAELDYSVQEFIKIHAHTGEHCSHIWDNFNSLDPRCKKCGKFRDSESSLPATAVTADFKPVSVQAPYGFNPVMKKQTPLIDKDIENEQQIKSQMQKYDAEMSEQKLQAKLKQIQAQAALEKAGVKTATGIVASFSGLGKEQQEKIIAEQKAKQQALAQIVQLLDLTEVIKIAEGKISEHPDPEPVKPKPLKIATGRKFR